MTGETLSDLEIAKNNLELTLRNNADYYHELTGTTEALTVGHLAATVRGREFVSSDNFKDLVRVIDWPYKQDRDLMSWELSFEDSTEGDAAFKEAFFANKINNATCYMFTKGYTIDTIPKDARAAENPTQYLYGSTPFKMRAELVAPELFTAFRAFFELVKFGDLHGYIDENPDTSESIVHAMRVSYMLLGRCMRSDDEKTHIKMIFGSDQSAEDITDISHHLFK